MDKCSFASMYVIKAGILKESLFVSELFFRINFLERNKTIALDRSERNLKAKEKSFERFWSSELAQS